MTDIKICGITSYEALNAAIIAGAKYLGFVFYKDSPRNIDYEKARALTNQTPSNLINVGLFVNPTIKEISTALEYADLDMIQLHGEETISDIQNIRSNFGLSVMKAIKIDNIEDLKPIASFEKVCDWILLDNKSSSSQGGTGDAFDWNLLEGFHFLKPWMLAGGLNIDNVQDALTITKPNAVDVSSGVEQEPGVKDVEKIKEFIAAVQQNS